MKAFRIPIFTLLLLLVLCLFAGSRVAACSADWQQQLQRVDIAAQQEDWPAAGASLSELYDSWEVQQAWLHMLIGHQELDEAEALLRRCMARADAQERDELAADLAELCSRLQLLDEMQRLTLRNVL